MIEKHKKGKKKGGVIAKSKMSESRKAIEGIEPLVGKIIGESEFNQEYFQKMVEKNVIDSSYMIDPGGVVKIFDSLGLEEKLVAIKALKGDYKADIDILYALAKDCKDEDISRAAVEKLKSINPKHGRYISAGSNHKNIRMDEFEKLKGEDDLAFVALSFGYEDVRMAAVKKLENLMDGFLGRDSLKAIALYSVNKDKRLAAVKKLKNNDSLKAVALRSTHKEVCLAAVKNMTSEHNLTDTAISSKDKDVRVAAFKRLTSVSSFADILDWSKDEDIRMAAMQKVNEIFNKKVY